MCLYRVQTKQGLSRKKHCSMSFNPYSKTLHPWCSVDFRNKSILLSVQTRRAKRNTSTAARALINFLHQSIHISGAGKNVQTHTSTYRSAKRAITLPKKTPPLLQEIGPASFGSLTKFGTVPGPAQSLLQVSSFFFLVLLAWFWKKTFSAALIALTFGYKLFHLATHRWIGKRERGKQIWKRGEERGACVQNRTRVKGRVRNF